MVYKHAQDNHIHVYKFDLCTQAEKHVYSNINKIKAQKASLEPKLTSINFPKDCLAGTSR